MLHLSSIYYFNSSFAHLYGPSDMYYVEQNLTPFCALSKIPMHLNCEYSTTRHRDFTRHWTLVSSLIANSD